MDFSRRKTKPVSVRGVLIGGDAPISVQSMCNTDMHDKEATLRQVTALADAGCDIVRLAVPDVEAAETIHFLKEKGVAVPLVADVHFDYRIALRALECGADKIRINPGNIGDEERIAAVVRACKAAAVPIRIGVNGGSLEKHILAKHGAPTAEALADSALYHASLLERFDFYDTVISVKASNVSEMIAANRILAERTSYPLHLGVTEAGGVSGGTVKSAVGIGTLLAEGIGDTVRVSLTADPVKEVFAARDILSALSLNTRPSMNIISCPTCGRTKIGLIELAAAFEEAIDRESLRQKPITVALMGCVVNGPGEAKGADIGIAGGDGYAALFRHGVVVGRVPQDKIVETLIEEIKRL